MADFITMLVDALRQKKEAEALNQGGMPQRFPLEQGARASQVNAAVSAMEGGMPAGQSPIRTYEPRK